ncbi:hypothetical protein D3C86_1278460 [compost metagenome]
MNGKYFVNPPTPIKLRPKLIKSLPKCFLINNGRTCSSVSPSKRITNLEKYISPRVLITCLHICRISSESNPGKSFPIFTISKLLEIEIISLSFAFEAI